MNSSLRCRILPQLAIGAIALGLFSTGCATPKSGSGEASDDDWVVATVNGRDVTSAELDDWIKDQLFKREVSSKPPSQAYGARKENLDFLIQDIVAQNEAEQRGIGIDEVVHDVVEELGPVTEVDVRGYYVQNRAQLPPDQPLEVLAPRIREFLEIQKLEQAGRTLTKRADVEIFLDPPRSTVAATGPFLGPEDAPVTVIEFSDFQCPYCSRAAPVVKSLVDQFPGQVRVIYRHMPLDFHPHARDAARASVCADQQGRFWDYHDALFANQRNLRINQLEEYAGELGLDVDELKACMTNPNTTATIDADSRDAREVGVNGTPAFFINGIMISGARPLADFVDIIEAELARLEDGS